MSGPSEASLPRASYEDAVTAMEQVLDRFGQAPRSQSYQRNVAESIVRHLCPDLLPPADDQKGGG